MTKFSTTKIILTLHFLLYSTGQALQDSYQQELETIKLDALPWHKRIWIKYRRIFGMLIPALFFHLFWWAYFIKFNHFGLFNSNYRISIMAVFGSLIAGIKFTIFADSW